MTTGTVTSFNPARRTGSIVCASGGSLPFTASDDALAIGDVVTFRATGGMTGLYALDVQRADPPAAPTPLRAIHSLHPASAGGWSLAA